MNFPKRTSHIQRWNRPTESWSAALADLLWRTMSPETVNMAAARKQAWKTGSGEWRKWPHYRYIYIWHWKSFLPWCNYRPKLAIGRCAGPSRLPVWSTWPRDGRVSEFLWRCEPKRAGAGRKGVAPSPSKRVPGALWYDRSGWPGGRRDWTKVIAGVPPVDCTSRPRRTRRQLSRWCWSFPGKSDGWGDASAPLRPRSRSNSNRST